MKVDVQYICPIGQLGDIFCSCTSYQMLGFQSLLLSLLSCVCCIFCWRVNENGSILIPQQVDHSNVFHMTESLHPKAVAHFFCHNAVNFRCGNWICPFYEIWVDNFFVFSTQPKSYCTSHKLLDVPPKLMQPYLEIGGSLCATTFLWQQPGGERKVTFIPSCMFLGTLPESKKFGACSPLPVFQETICSMFFMASFIDISVLQGLAIS